MLYVIYATEKFKDLLSKELFQLSSKAKNLQPVEFVPQTQINEDNLYTIFDRANALIIQINGELKKSLSLLIAARIGGIPVVAINTGKAQFANKVLRMYPMSQLKEALLYLNKQVQQYKNPTATLPFKGSTLTPEETGLPGQMYYIYSGSQSLSQNKNANKLKKRRSIIFYHGITARSVTYYKLLNRLSKDFDMYAIDLPLHGKSYNPKRINSLQDITIPAIIATLAILQKHKISLGNTILMGHSLGASIVLDFLIKLETASLLHLTQQYPKAAQIIQYFHKTAYSQRAPAKPYKAVFVTPTGLPIENNKTLLTVKALFTRVQLISDYLKQAEAVRKGLSDQVLYSIEKIFDTPIPILQLTKKLMQIVPAGLKTLPQKRLTTYSHIIFANKDPYFDCEYKLKYLQLFTNTRLDIVKGYHDFLITHPESLVEIVAE